MIVLMGGSGSTGSSLLKNILNRHPSIFAGEESNFFCKHELYDDFEKHKHRINLRKISGLKNFGWHIYNGIDLINNHYPINSEELNSFIDESDSFHQLSHKLQKHFSKQDNQTIWLEKTPANASSFDKFLNCFPDGKVIHITRDPLDTIASLTRRGYNLYYAVCIYLINTASGLNVSGNNRAMLVKYEDLIYDAESEITKICNFLEIEPITSILKSKNESVPNSKLDGWTYDETENIGKKSIGKFQQLTESAQEEILAAIEAIRISSIGVKEYNVSHKTIQDIALELNYTVPSPKSKPSNKIIQYRIMDQFRRIIRGYKSGLKYPITISNYEA